MHQKHTRARGQKPRFDQVFPVKIDGHQTTMTRDQVIANGQGWKRCHGEHGGTKVNSLSIKPIGDKIFIKDGGKLSGYDLNELAVALPEIQVLIDDKKQSAVGQ